MNKSFKEIFSARVAGAVGAARSVKGVAHTGLKGLLREIVVRDLFQPLLPPSIGLGHGVIVSAYEQQSPEQDVIIYNRGSVPSLVMDNTHGLFPIESVLFTVEVKSCLNADELKKTHASASAIHQLTFIPAAAAPIESVIPCIFAFDSDLVEKDERERFKEHFGDGPPAVRAVCIVGRGYYFWHDTGWQMVPPDDQFREVLRLIADVVSAHERVAKSRTTPHFLHYLEKL